MIQLYHCFNARSFRALWALEELDLEYDLKILPFPPRVRAPEYKQVNPLGTIPLLLDGSTRMTESSAICHYLATRYGPSPLAPGVEEEDYGAFLNWNYFADATLTFPQTLVLRYGRFEPTERRQPQVVEDYSKWFLGRLRAVESVLSDGRAWLCADRFTVADISIGYALLLASLIGLSEHFDEPTRTYLQRLQAREGYRRAQASQTRAAQAAGLNIDI